MHCMGLHGDTRARLFANQMTPLSWLNALQKSHPLKIFALPPFWWGIIWFLLQGQCTKRSCWTWTQGEMRILFQQFFSLVSGCWLIHKSKWDYRKSYGLIANWDDCIEKLNLDSTIFVVLTNEPQETLRQWTWYEVRWITLQYSYFISTAKRCS